MLRNLLVENYIEGKNIYYDALSFTGEITTPVYNFYH